MPAISPSQVSFKEILVASDLSDASENAVNYAKAIAKRFGSHITLAHVSEPPSPIAIPEGGWIEDDSATFIEQQVEAAGIAPRAEGFSAEAVNRLGSLSHQIQALAEAHHADLVVLGTHGRRGLNPLLFGSEAESLIRHADLPVLTVGPSAAHAEQEAWTPKNVLCATSLIPQAARVVAYGFILAQSTGASFSLLSIEAPRHDSDERDWHTFEDALAEALPEGERAKVHIQSLLSGKSPAANIIDVALALKPDLIVMGARASYLAATHLPAGVLAQVLVNAPCPVLMINTD